MHDGDKFEFKYIVDIIDKLDDIWDIPDPDVYIVHMKIVRYYCRPKDSSTTTTAKEMGYIERIIHPSSNV